MNRFEKKTDAPFANNVAAALNKSILAGTLHADLKTATTFVENELAKRKGNLPCKFSFPEACLCWIFTHASSPWKI